MTFVFVFDLRICLFYLFVFVFDIVFDVVFDVVVDVVFDFVFGFVFVFFSDFDFDFVIDVVFDVVGEQEEVAVVHLHHLVAVVDRVLRGIGLAPKFVHAIAVRTVTDDATVELRRGLALRSNPRGDKGGGGGDGRGGQKIAAGGAG